MNVAKVGFFNSYAKHSEQEHLKNMPSASQENSKDNAACIESADRIIIPRKLKGGGMFGKYVQPEKRDRADKGSPIFKAAQDFGAGQISGQNADPDQKAAKIEGRRQGMIAGGLFGFGNLILLRNGSALDPKFFLVALGAINLSSYLAWKHECTYTGKVSKTKYSFAKKCWAYGLIFSAAAFQLFATDTSTNF
jgi:hypothetical protein